MVVKQLKNSRKIPVHKQGGMFKVATQDKKKREDKETREKVLVPVRRREDAAKKENLENAPEKLWQLPRRWHIY
jgi:hypothetical protein